MLKVFLFAFCVVLAKAQYPIGSPYDGVPNPYQYSYSAPSIGGESSHQESGDGQGRVTGSYSVTDEDGRSRTVEYVADELGFRANIITNEPGTSNQAPADVSISSSADEGLQSYSIGGAPGPVAYAPAPVAVAAPGPLPLAYGGGAPVLL
ncbi:cuticle protein 10.9 [Parasteatoda tepidariorum]|nr:cuticle protein 10.9 [Parasteatoda tepidariorum]